MVSVYPTNKTVWIFLNLSKFGISTRVTKKHSFCKNIYIVRDTPQYFCFCSRAVLIKESVKSVPIWVLSKYIKSEFVKILTPLCTFSSRECEWGQSIQIEFWYWSTGYLIKNNFSSPSCCSSFLHRNSTNTTTWFNIWH